MTESAARRVVAAVDGSPHSRVALRRASEEASAHGATLEVLFVWSLLDQMTGTDFDPHYGSDRARADLERIVAEELGSQPPHPTTLRVENDLPPRAILAAAVGAWLVVVGSRGFGGFSGLLLGSVSGHVARHAVCPVLIVPGADRVIVPPAARSTPL